MPDQHTQSWGDLVPAVGLGARDIEGPAGVAALSEATGLRPATAHRIAMEHVQSLSIGLRMCNVRYQHGR